MQTLILFLIYTGAQILMLVYHALKSAKSKLYVLNTVKEYLQANLADLLLLWGVATGLFFLLWQNPTLLNWVASKTGYDLPLAFKMTRVNAWMFGLASNGMADVLIHVGCAIKDKLKGKAEQGQGAAAGK